MTSYYWSTVAMGLSYTVSENSDFGWKRQNFPTPVYLMPPLREFPLEFRNVVSTLRNYGQAPIRWWEKVLCVDSFRYSTQCDRQTDRQMDLLKNIALCMHSMLMHYKNITSLAEVINNHMYVICFNFWHCMTAWQTDGQTELPQQVLHFATVVKMYW